MKTLVIASQFDPGGSILDSLVNPGVDHAVDSFILERGVERLCPCIVLAHPRTPYRGTNAVGVEVVQESLRRVLATSVRVEDRYTLLDRAAPDRHVNGLAHQEDVHVVGHRITHDLQGVSSPEGSQDK